MRTPGLMALLLIPFSLLADRFGRTGVMRAGLLGAAAFSLASAWAPDFWLLVITSYSIHYTKLYEASACPLITASMTRDIGKSVNTGLTRPLSGSSPIRRNSARIS